MRTSISCVGLMSFSFTSLYRERMHETKKKCPHGELTPLIFAFDTETLPLIAHRELALGIWSGKSFKISHCGLTWIWNRTF